MIALPTQTNEKQQFDDLIAFNFKPKPKMSIPRLVLDVQLYLLLLIGATSLTTYLWQLVTCPAC